MDPGRTEFMAKEVALSRKLGVSRDVLRVARSMLVEGTDWAMVGRDVVYSLDGLERLQEVVMVRDKGRVKKPAGAGNGAAGSGVLPDMPAEKKAVVTAATKNRLVVLAEIDGEPVRVRVRDGSKFVPGMDLRVQLIEEDLYEHVGRCPRARGVW